MIVGVSGYIGSGKDTVAKIIQCLSCDIDDWFKTNTVEALEKWNGNYDNLSDWKVKKFAGKLKEIAAIILNVPVEKFELQEYKSSYLDKQWAYWAVTCLIDGEFVFEEGRFSSKEEADEHAYTLANTLGTFKTEYVVGYKQMTVRQFLQELGTNACRNVIHSNFWVNSLMSEYVITHGNRSTGGQQVNHVSFGYPDWIISDVRFPNEAQAIKDKGGVVIRVERPTDASTQEHRHISETSLDNWDFDYKIIKDGSLEDLVKKVGDFMAKSHI